MYSSCSRDLKGGRKLRQKDMMDAERRSGYRLEYS